MIFVINKVYCSNWYQRDARKDQNETCISPTTMIYEMLTDDNIRTCLLKRIKTEIRLNLKAYLKIKEIENVGDKNKKSILQ